MKVSGFGAFRVCRACLGLGFRVWAHSFFTAPGSLFGLQFKVADRCILAGGLGSQLAAFEATLEVGGLKKSPETSRRSSRPYLFWVWVSLFWVSGLKVSGFRISGFGVSGFRQDAIADSLMNLNVQTGKPGSNSALRPEP